MSQRWQAYILTVDNIIEVVEFDTPGISRSAAEAQVQSMYGAKEVYSCNPISTPSSNSSGSFSGVGDGSSSGIGPGGILALVVIGCAIWVFVEYTPYVVMGVLGATGVWIGGKIGNKIMALILTFALGAFGFYLGTDWSNQFNNKTGESEWVEDSNSIRESEWVEDSSFIGESESIEDTSSIRQTESIDEWRAIPEFDSFSPESNSVITSPVIAEPQKQTIQKDNCDEWGRRRGPGC